MIKQSLTRIRACVHTHKYICVLKKSTWRVQTSAKKVISKCTVNYTHSIEYIENTGIRNTRLHRRLLSDQSPLALVFGRARVKGIQKSGT